MNTLIVLYDWAVMVGIILSLCLTDTNPAELGLLV